MHYLAIIPARAGSKGVPGKNLRPIAGKPLVAWSVGQAIACPKVSRTLVSTDGPDIAAAAREAGAEVVLRPNELARDATPTEPVLLHALEELACDGWEPDAVVLLQPTSPLRLPDSLGRAIAEFESQQADSLVSVCESHAFFWKHPEKPEALYDYMRRPRRQDIPPQERQYRENGSIYITRTDVLRTSRNRLGGRICMYLMDEAESWEIDSITDFRIVETLMLQAGLQ